VNRDQERIKSFTRRALLLGGGQALLLSALTARMYYLQVIESDRYRMLAEDNRINLRLLSPPRGRILDRFGLPMAANQQNYRVIIVAEQTKSVAKTLARLGELIDLTEYEVSRITREIKRKRSFIPVTVRENLSWEDVAKIEINAPDLPGVTIEVGQSRYYPYSDRAAHLLGYVAAVSEKELTGDPLLELPDFRIGKNGAEKAYDMKLRGRAGRSQMEVNALGRVIRELERQEGQPGDDITLSIDAELQAYTHERMGEQSGGAVVLDVVTGEVLAMVSAPSFDPSAFYRGIKGEEWRALLNNEKAPLINKPIAGQYAPGSTFKMVVALAALESGAVTPEYRVFCPGHRDLGNVRFHCWKKGGHGSVDMTGGIMHSCDVYFYDIAQRTGIDKIADMARRFGFGQTLGIELPGEKPGLIPTRDWKKTILGHSWSLGETLVAGIGQGYITVTPLQLAVMVARVATGRAVAPTITRRVPNTTAAAVGTVALAAGPDDEAAAQPPAFPALNIAPGWLNVVRGGMNAVSNIPGGTAYGARIKEREFALAGKTGTAQFKRITMAERQAGLLKWEQRPWKDRDHALFVAFAPVDAPRYAIGIVIEHGGGGAAVAAPIARDILLETQRRDSSRRSPASRLAEADGANRERADRPADGRGTGGGG
jgi:penicillin-binding protein 2